MRVLTKEETKIQAGKLGEEIIERGAVFIHPTDTIYGLGCDATNDTAVKRIRDIKSRFKKPFSVIAPSKEWITKNCVVTKEAKEWIEKLPGPYTLIMKLKNKKAVSEHTNFGVDTIGVRIPDHWFSHVASALGKPIVTTSANKVDQDFMTTLDDLNPIIKESVDFIIYEGEKRGRPSQLVHLDQGKVTIKKR
ncbi:threonylcarbamoyl-AMP synthase [Candidatus Woesearchaeota archaeon]|nr:threonylcarbamoyl-AMP synthase [Candidatus Woesearchaeota archaeon]